MVLLYLVSCEDYIQVRQDIAGLVLVHKSPDSAGTDCKLACKAVHALDGTTGMSKKAARSEAICEFLLGLRECEA